MLFSGSLRRNLDPFDKRTDEELWNALEVTHLKSFIIGLGKGLQHRILEGGENMRYHVLDLPGKVVFQEIYRLI